MAEYIEYSKYSKLDHEVLNVIGNRVMLHSVVLVKCNQYKSWEPAGSGTLIKYNNVHAVLTAGHVVYGLKDATNIGMGITGGDHCFSIDTNIITMNSIYNITDPPTLPDLGLIMLPIEIARSIEAREKTFINLEKRRIYINSVYDDLHKGVWVLWGAPSEMSYKDSLSDMSGMIETFNCLVGFTGVKLLDDVDGYDAISALVNYDDCSEGVPTSFQGVSGGGLWNVHLIMQQDGSIAPVEYILAGVACIQSPVEGGKRTLTCHGIRSIYKYIDEHLIGPNIASPTTQAPTDK